MESSPTVALGPTEYHHMNSQLPAHSAFALLPWLVGQSLAIPLRIILLSVPNAFVLLEPLDHIRQSELALIVPHDPIQAGFLKVPRLRKINPTSEDQLFEL